MDHGDYRYGWLDDLLADLDAGFCGVCGAPMVPHLWGLPLTVCPRCFPDEAQR